MPRTAIFFHRLAKSPRRLARQTRRAAPRECRRPRPISLAKAQFGFRRSGRSCAELADARAFVKKGRSISSSGDLIRLIKPLSSADASRKGDERTGRRVRAIDKTWVKLACGEATSSSPRTGQRHQVTMLIAGLVDKRIRAIHVIRERPIGAKIVRSLG